jgi:dipeptidyl aminopeptidase/acylaminoacyl peptidase
MWPWENWQKMLERSPVYYVEKAKTPLLIVGGDEDPRVHPSQSLALYRYLKILGQAPVRYVIYPGEKHGNEKAAARYDFSLRLLRWFDHYLVGAGGEPPPHELDYGIDSGNEEGEEE